MAPCLKPGADIQPIQGEAAAPFARGSNPCKKSFQAQLIWTCLGVAAAGAEARPAALV